jgi:tetratricopeptide (TPR) repeat protein
MRLLREIRTLMGNYHIKSGLYHYYRGEFKPAIEFFQRALRGKPSLTESDRRTARHYLTLTCMTAAEQLERKGELGAAAEEYERAIAVSPTYPDVRYRLGLVLERLGRTEAAIQRYRDAMGCQDDYLEAQLALAFCLLSSGRTDEAAGAMERVLALKIQRLRGPFEQGMMELRGGRLQAAADLFQEAFRLEPQRFEEQLRAAVERLKAEDYEEALELLDVGLKLHPRYPDLHNYRGIALCELGRTEEGIEAFRAACALNPGFLVPRLNLSFALVRAERLHEAEVELEQVVRRDPSEAVARAKLDELRTSPTPKPRRPAARGVSP